MGHSGLHTDLFKAVQTPVARLHLKRPFLHLHTLKISLHNKESVQESCMKIYTFRLIFISCSVEVMNFETLEILYSVLPAPSFLQNPGAPGALTQHPIVGEA